MRLDHIVIGLEKLNNLKKKKAKNHMLDKRTQNRLKKQTRLIWKKKRFFDFPPGGGREFFDVFPWGGQGVMDSLRTPFTLFTIFDEKLVK